MNYYIKLLELKFTLRHFDRKYIITTISVQVLGIHATTSHVVLYCRYAYNSIAQEKKKKSASHSDSWNLLKCSYLNLGCLLMASSGKKRDFEAPPSTGVGLYSGTVNPGHPNLYNTTMRVQVVMNTACDFKRVRWPKIRISVYKGKKKDFKKLESKSDYF